MNTLTKLDMLNRQIRTYLDLFISTGAERWLNEAKKTQEIFEEVENDETITITNNTK